MNHHTLLDVAPLALTGRLIGDKRKLFASSIESPGYREHLDAVSVDVPGLEGPAVQELNPDTLVGALDAAVYIPQWLGPDYPTIIYHHGTRERPASKSTFQSYSFRPIFLEDGPSIDANLIAVRAPLHTLSMRKYLDRLTKASNFMAMLAVSVEVTEQLIEQLDDANRVAVAGLSLGGFVTNLHRAFHDTADVYVPMLAGSLYSDVVLSGAFKHVTADRARENPAAVRELVDFVDEFQQADADAYPLLARYDANVRYEPQRKSYGNLPIRTLKKGHITATMASGRLREHVLDGLRPRAVASQ